MIEIREGTLSEMLPMIEKYHGYKSIGKVATYCFVVEENGQVVAGYTWNPPAPGAARSVCPECPAAVLALTRMVAVPKNERKLKHVSKPLMLQMKKLIDRTRYPVLVTYSDESLGHTGYVYKCSGWEATSTSKTKTYENHLGQRISSYSSGRTDVRGLKFVGIKTIQRWEHWICERGKALQYLERHWTKISTGSVWASGNQAFTWVKKKEGSHE